MPPQTPGTEAPTREELQAILAGEPPPQSPSGVVEKGNIELTTLPRFEQPDGSSSTVNSISIGVDENEVLIPTIVGGKQVSEEEAIQHFRETGKHLGVFRDIAAADAYAQKLHEDFAAGRLEPVKPAGSPAYRPPSEKPLERSTLEEIAAWAPPGRVERGVGQVKEFAKVPAKALKEALRIQLEGVSYIPRAAYATARGKELPEPPIPPITTQIRERLKQAKAIKGPASEIARYAQYLALPFDVAGAPITEFGTALGEAGAGVPGAAGRALGLGGMLPLGGLGARGIARSMRAGGRGAAAPLGGRGRAPGVSQPAPGRAARGGRPRPAGEEPIPPPPGPTGEPAPGGAPFVMNGKRVTKVSMAGKVRGQERVRVEFEDGTSVVMDAQALANEVKIQAEAHMRAKGDAARAAEREAAREGAQPGRPGEPPPPPGEPGVTPPPRPSRPSPTAKPKTYTVYRGSGRTTDKGVYGAEGQGPVFVDSTYYAFTKDIAGRFGPKVSKHKVELRNPLVIKTADQYNALARKAGVMPDFFTRKETYLGDFGPAMADAAKLKALIQQMGHDGVVITPEAVLDRGAVRSIFGDAQVIKFGGEAVSPEPTAPPPLAPAARRPGALPSGRVPARLREIYAQAPSKYLQERYPATTQREAQLGLPFEDGGGGGGGGAAVPLPPGTAPTTPPPMVPTEAIIADIPPNTRIVPVDRAAGPGIKGGRAGYSVQVRSGQGWIQRGQVATYEKAIELANFQGPPTTTPPPGKVTGKITDPYAGPSPPSVRDPRFDAQKHSLSDAVRRVKLRFRGKPPGEFLDALGSRGVGAFRSEKRGLAPDMAMQHVRELGFDIPDDMGTGDFLRLVAEDATAKKGGPGPRTWAKGKQFDEEVPAPEEAIPPPPAPSGPVEKVESLDSLRQQIKRARAERRVSELERLEERLAIRLEDSYKVGPRSMRFPPPGSDTGIKPGTRAERTILESVMGDDAGFWDFADFIRSFRQKQRKGPQSEHYKKVVDAQRDYARQTRWSTRAMDFMTDLPKDIHRRFFERDRDIKAAIAYMEELGVKLDPKEDPRFVLDLARGGTTGRQQRALLDFVDVRKAAKRNGMLTDLTQYIQLAGWNRAHGIVEDKMRRAFETKNYEAYAKYKQSIISGEVLPAGYHPGRIAKELEALKDSYAPAEWEVLKNHADNFFSIPARYWDMLHTEGVISEQVHLQGVVRGKEYIPLNRIHEAFEFDSEWGGITSLNAAQRKSLHKLEGSPLPTRDPWESSYIWATQVINDTARNWAMRSVHDALRLAPESMGKLVKDLHGDMRPPVGWTRLSYYVDGRKTHFALPELMAMSLRNTSPQEVTYVRKLLQMGKKGLQVGAVGANLAFAVPNIMRDVGEFWALSEASKPLSPKSLKRILTNLGKGLGHVIRQDEWYKQMLESGAAGSTLGKNISPEYWVESPWTSRGKLGSLVSFPIRTIQEVVNVLEETTKMASYRTLKEQGFSDTEAAIKTRRYGGTPDYGRKGTDSDAINLIFMFANVRAQGQARMWRRLAPRRGKGPAGEPLGGITGDIAQPWRVPQIAVPAMFMALAAYFYNYRFRDKEGRPELRHVPDYDRENNFIILRDEINPGTGRHLYWKIRKPDVLKLIYNPIDEAIWDIAGELDANWYQQALDFISNAIPSPVALNLEESEGIISSVGRGIGSSLNPLIKEPFEQGTNLDFYRNIPIETRAEEELAPEERFNPRTSPTAVLMARGVPEWAPDMFRSPKRLEHAFISALAGLGEGVLAMSDATMEMAEDLAGRRFTPQTRGTYRAGEELPFIGPVARRFMGGGYGDQIRTELEDGFYRMSQMSTEIQRTYNKIDKTDPERADAYLDELKGRETLLMLQGFLRKVSGKLRELREERYAALDLPGLTEEERAAQSRKILEQYVGTLQYGLEEIRAAVLQQMLADYRMEGGEGKMIPLPPMPPDLFRRERESPSPGGR